MILATVFILLFTSVARGYDSFDYGKVVVVLSLGRSGSSFMCQIIANAVDAQRSAFVLELFGGNKEAMLNVEDPLKLTQQHLKRSRELHSDRPIGFKWKPLVDTLVYDEVWRWLASRPGIAVIHSTRNSLDRYLSRMKYELNDISGHCRVQNKVCQEKANVAAQTKFAVNISDVMESLKRESEEFVRLNSDLDRLGVSRLHVRYEDFIHGSAQRNIENLQRVASYSELAFLAWKRTPIQPAATTSISRNLTRLKTELHDVPLPQPLHVTAIDLKSSFTLTSATSQRELVENYDALANALQATRFRDLLH